MEYHISNGQVSSGIELYYDTMYISSGGSASNTIINDGGWMHIDNGGSASDTTINNRGHMEVSSGGVAHNTTVSSGGSIFISSGGVANCTTVSRGCVFIYDGGVASDNAMSGGNMYISSGGVASNTTMSGGIVFIENGGIANNITVDDSHMYIYSGASATDIVAMSGTMLAITVASNTYIQGRYNGSAFEMKDAKMSGYTIDAGGSMSIFSGGVASDTTLSSGSIYIYSSGVASDTTVSSGIVYIENGGVASNTTMSGGIVYIDNGVANNTSVNKGSAYIFSGGVHRGSLQIGREATVSAHSGAVIDFTVAGRTGADGYLINDLSLISGAPTYTITVSVNQEFGTYKLAQGAGNFSGSITIGNGTINYGSITVNGEDLNYNGATYSLDQKDGNLTLSIQDARPPAVFIYSSGNCVSSGATISGATIANGGNNSMHISSGGVANNTTVSYGGSMVIANGGVANDTTVNDGYMSISSGGVANNTTVKTYGSMCIHSGGVANDITIMSSGSLSVASGGSASGINMNGGLLTLDTGAVLTEKNYLAGRVDISGEANIRNAEIFIDFDDQCAASYDWGEEWGFIENLESLRDASLTVVVDNCAADYFLLSWSDSFSGYVTVSDGTSTLGTLSYGASFIRDGLVYSLTNDGEGGVYFSVNYEGSEGFCPEDSWDVEYYADAFNNKTITRSSNIICGDLYPDYYDEYPRADLKNLFVAGKMVLYNQFTVTDSKIYGTLELMETTATRITVNSGGIIKNYGDAADTVINSGGMMIVGYKEHIVRYEGDDVICYANGTARNTTVNSGGVLNVNSGGSADGVNANGGKVVVYDAAVANITATNGAQVHVHDEGSVENVEVSSGAVIRLGEMTSAENITVDATASLFVGFGSDVENVSINGGTVHVTAGGMISDVNISNDGKLYLYGGAVLDGVINIKGTVILDDIALNNSHVNFILSESFSTPMVNDMALLSGESFSVDVDNAAPGTYILGGNASGFASSVTVTDAGTELGALSVGDSLNIGRTNYHLAEENDSLILYSVYKTTPDIISGDASGVRLDAAGDHIIEYSADGFKTVVRFDFSATGVDTYGIPVGNWQYRVRFAEEQDWATGEDFAGEVSAPQVFTGTANGCTDLFFVRCNEQWESGFAARHSGILNDWTGTGERAMLVGKNKIKDVYTGSSDANVLVMTDDANGDALFLDDIYTSLGNQARVSMISEIRAGAGNDIVDMTSQKFACIGESMTVFAGEGDDIIWANRGSNTLYGDAGNDRLIGGADHDILIGGAGNDRMHGGGGDDIFCFGKDFGNDQVEQLENGSVTLWFAEGSSENWNAETLTYSDGVNSVSVSGVDVENIFLKFGDTASAVAGAFDDSASGKIFEESNGMLA